MKNALSFYYDLHPDTISYMDDKYFFEYSNSNYVLERLKRPEEDIEYLYDINIQMLKKNILVHEIKLNKDNNIITYINGLPYVLMELYINLKARINLSDVCYINNNSVSVTCDKTLNRSDWISLWKTKNDYFEAQINEIWKKYPNLCNYANYYIGLAENAILYIREASKLEDITLMSVCHKRIGSEDNLYELYNPLRYIYDFRIRDVCEYIKSAFFNGENAYFKVLEYFQNDYLSYKEALLFYGRLLYPSYFFDLYDEIVNNDLKENLIDKIITKADDYEMFLANVYLFLTKLYGKYIPEVEWVKKRSYI